MSHSQEFDAFTNLVDRVIAVPREELLRREAQYKREMSAAPTKRGPKPKAKATKPSSSGRA
jgi:hypothetical protein